MDPIPAERDLPIAATSAKVDGVTERAHSARPAAAKAEPMDLRSLFETHYASIWRLLRRLGVLPAQLDDAAQEVFWVAARRLCDIEPGREHSFLYGVALRVAANEVRRQRAAMPVTDLEQVPLLPDQRPSPEDELAEQQARELLDDVLNRMPIDLRTVFVLFEIEGLEVRQIAEIEEIPVGTASSRLRRAREEFSAIAKRVRADLVAREGYR
jgi:RNA polymerase sigma-70 factor, ECF subfamily